MKKIIIAISQRINRIWRFFTVKPDKPTYVLGQNAYRSDRFLAAIIDGTLQLILTIPLIIFFGIEGFKTPSLNLIIYTFLYGITLTLVLHGYLLFFYGQTIGKRITGIRIENIDGTKAGFSKIIFVRYLPMSLLSLIPVVGRMIPGLFDPLFIFGKKRKCLHDYIARTKVSNTDI